MSHRPTLAWRSLAVHGPGRPSRRRTAVLHVGTRPTVGHDAGFVTVAVLALALALLAFGGVLASLGAVAVARHRAAAAADLAALAAAGHVIAGQPGACAAAWRVTRAQAAELTGCSISGTTVEVRATARPPGPLGSLGAATSTARAGPG